MAVSNLNLHVRQGTVHALRGPNGAAKKTVLNLLTNFDARCSELIESVGLKNYRTAIAGELPYGPSGAQTLSDRRVAQRQLEFALHAPVVQPPGFGHKTQLHRGQLRIQCAACEALRPGQLVEIGRQVKVVAHFEISVITGVGHALRFAAPQGRQASTRQVVGVNVIGVHVVS